uniref:CSON013721 protein n=1 Tax=Culicoides sonorensis TaxID=179676 RepID=A0A336M8J5_CULSO
MSSMSPSEKRLQKELMSLIKEPPPGVTVDAESVSQNLSQWIVNIDGVEGTLYEGEHFQLSPALSVQSVCLSISSMLSSCREKKRPPDNTIYVKTCKKNPKETKWWYHDDSV